MWRGVVRSEICFRGEPSSFTGGDEKKRQIQDASLVLNLSYWVSDGITDFDCADKKKKKKKKKKKSFVGQIK